MSCYNYKQGVRDDVDCGHVPGLLSIRGHLLSRSGYNNTLKVLPQHIHFSLRSYLSFVMNLAFVASLPVRQDGETPQKIINQSPTRREFCLIALKNPMKKFQKSSSV